MGDLIAKVKRNASSMVDAWQKDVVFSHKLAFFRAADDLTWRLGMKRFAAFFQGKKDGWILNYLKGNLQPVLDSYAEDHDIGTCVENAPIWVCWWTGEETAPALVKQCIRSIRRNADSHPIKLITKNNYMDYLELTESIMRKVTANKICLAHLADYIRVSLLARYGGLWLDATIFCPTRIPDDYFQMPLFTCKSPYSESRYISMYQWTTFCLGGNRNHVFYRFLKDAFEAYWDTEETAIDYLFFDYIIALAHKELPTIRNALEGVPANNPHRDDLQAAMNAMLPAEQFDAVIQPDTWLYKLSWRENYQERTQEGKTSVYGHFLQLR